MATAADFQRAFQVDLPIGQVVGENIKLAQEQERLRKEEAEKQALYGLKAKEDLFGEAAKLGSSNELLNNLNQTQLANITKSISDAEQKVGRPLSAIELQPYRQKMAELHALQTQYKGLEKNVDDALAQAGRYTNVLDLGKFKTDIMAQGVVRDENGSISVSPDAAMSFYNQVVSNPEIQSNYANQAQLHKELNTEFGKTFTPQKIDVSTPQERASGIIRYHNLIPGITKMNPKSNTPELDVDKVKLGDTEYDALTPEAYEAYASLPLARTDINLKKKELAAKYRSFSTDLNDEQKNRLAAYESIKEHYKGIGNLKPVETDDSELKRRREEARHVEDMRMRNEYLNIAKENQADKKAAIKLSNLDAAFNATEGVTDNVNRAFPVDDRGYTDISSVSRKRAFLDPKTNTYVKLYSFRNANGELELYKQKAVTNYAAENTYKPAKEEPVKITQDESQQLIKYNRPELAGGFDLLNETAEPKGVYAPMVSPPAVNYGAAIINEFVNAKKDRFKVSQTNNTNAR